MQDKLADFDFHNNDNGGDGDVGTGNETGGLAADGGTAARQHDDAATAGKQAGVSPVAGEGPAAGVRIGAEIPYHAKQLLENLKLMQAQIDALPGPRLHQDH